MALAGRRDPPRAGAPRRQGERGRRGAARPARRGDRGVARDRRAIGAARSVVGTRRRWQPPHDVSHRPRRCGRTPRCGAGIGRAVRAGVAARPDDRGSLHARSADETVEIAAYLRGDEHIRAATQAGADAIHPGYGFLAETAEFAAAVTNAGIAWIGPPADALRTGGDKLAAKRVAAEAGVPVVPYGQVEELDLPLVIKAAAGGGGGGERGVCSRPQVAGGLRPPGRER